MRSDGKMVETLYDTPYFISAFAAKDPTLKKRLRAELDTKKPRYVSAITIHEVYRLSLEEDGRDVARIRRTAIERDFEVIDVDSDIAAEAAEIKVAQGGDYPLADAIIAATATIHKFVCFTDDEHIKNLTRVRTRWL